MIGWIKKLFGGNPVNYQELVSRGAVIIDVRSSGEFISGHLPGAKNYPLDGIKGKITELKKLNKPLITVCKSGARSSMAKGILQSAGLEVYNGGSWNRLAHQIA